MESKPCRGVAGRVARMVGTFSLVVALGVGLGVAVTPAGAIPVGAFTATNFDTLTLGVEQVEVTKNFRDVSSTIIDTGTSSVWFNQNTGIYTYVLQLNPTNTSTFNLYEFNTGFNVLGFTGIAGYSFSDAMSAGAPDNGSGALQTVLDNDGTVDMNVLAANFWDSTHLVPIKFFYQSTYAPGLASYKYNMTTATAAGSLLGYAPLTAPVAATPEPASLVFLASGMAGMVGRGLWRWRKGKGLS